MFRKSGWIFSVDEHLASIAVIKRKNFNMYEIHVV